MTTNPNLAQMHKMFTAAGIEHRYTPGDLVITVIRGTHIWTVIENHIIYWGNDIDVCETRYYEFARSSDAYDYIADAYSKAQ